MGDVRSLLEFGPTTQVHELTEALQGLWSSVISGRVLNCVQRTRERPGRTVGICGSVREAPNVGAEGNVGGGRSVGLGMLHDVGLGRKSGSAMYQDDAAFLSDKTSRRTYRYLVVASAVYL